MKKFKYLMMSGVVAMLYACGSDSDSGSGSIAGGDGTEQHGLVVIDESKSLIKPYLQKSVEGCFMSGLDFSWKTIDVGVNQMTFKYEFVGDTLVLHSGKAFTEYGAMYVGGTNGNLNGTWQSTLCTYNNDEEETTCYKLCSEVKASILKKYDVTSEDELDAADYEEFEEEYEKKRAKNPCVDEDDVTDVTIKISGDDITMIEKPRETEEKEFTDYMNSEYIADLYEAIYNGDSNAPSIYDLTDEDSASVKKYRKRAEIEEKNRTTTSLTFVVDEETQVSVTVNKINLDRENDKYEIGMTVASGKRTCELNYMSGRVNKGDCDSDNLGKFDDPEKIVTEDGTVYKQVSYMEDSNMDDFDVCVGKILRNLAGSSAEPEEDPRCTSVKANYKSCVNEYMDYYDASRSEAESYCEDLYDVDYYCNGGLAKTAASTTKLSKNKFKQLQRAHINALEMLLQ